ncbi:MAG: IS200/IS605 family element transposase accessory protein TnpB, partial [Thaumarchaeota archaeon]|nr:IS200/IS605 family element transposase accessory protein TnpB [Nitrososphaerota archaeon]
LVSKRIVQQAKEQKLGIVMEKLTGIRKLYRRGNGQGANYRARLNGWSYHELQRQIEYKANWEGIPVICVSARGTSVNCSICGSKTYPNGQRTLFCAKCNISIDRDVNGARNILAKGGLGFSPNGLPSEAMIGERAGVAPILKVDGGKVTQG